jgi:Zn-dependent protease
MVPAMDGIPSYVAMYVLFVFSTTCHEAAHAYVAARGGDQTAYSLGHVTLDPTPHIQRSPWGMVIAPLIGLYLMGWPLGWASVPYDSRWGQRFPLRASLMSLAGPATNFALAFLSLATLRILIQVGVFHTSGVGARVGFVSLSEGVAHNSPLAALAFLLSNLAWLNLLLGAFNLMPFPPLDGAGVLEGLSPRGIGALYDRLREFPAHQFIGWIAATELFPYLFPAIQRVIVLGLYF